MKNQPCDLLDAIERHLQRWLKMRDAWSAALNAALQAGDAPREDEVRKVIAACDEEIQRAESILLSLRRGEVGRDG